MSEDPQLDDFLARLQKYNISAMDKPVAPTSNKIVMSEQTKRHDSDFLARLRKHNISANNGVSRLLELPREIRQNILGYAGNDTGRDSNPYVAWLEGRYFIEEDIARLSEVHPVVALDMEFVGGEWRKDSNTIWDEQVEGVKQLGQHAAGFNLKLESFRALSKEQDRSHDLWSDVKQTGQTVGPQFDVILGNIYEMRAKQGENEKDRVMRWWPWIHSHTAGASSNHSPMPERAMPSIDEAAKDMAAGMAKVEAEVVCAGLSFLECMEGIHQTCLCGPFFYSEQLYHLITDLRRIARGDHGRNT
ncbi:hypothetical protein FKW77_000604 [Venturia effusa]|uniref:Uncharacterized protein n=1 Tax=Venturia effusa TaxID=50376 RepID=A0A517L2L2_9PEZI|nr:hypothetical protein FKW77_000604 [Venturia effusa]